WAARRPVGPSRPFRPGQFPGRPAPCFGLPGSQAPREDGPFRQAMQLRIEDWPQFLPDELRDRLIGWDIDQWLFELAVQRPLRLGAERRAIRHTVKPAADLLRPSKRCGFADEDEKGGLKGIFSIGRIMQHAPADAEHHRPMPAHECGERRLIAMEQEPFEKLRIAEAAGIAGQNHAAQLPHEAVALSHRHWANPSGSVDSPYITAKNGGSGVKNCRSTSPGAE